MIPQTWVDEIAKGTAFGKRAEKAVRRMQSKQSGGPTTGTLIRSALESEDKLTNASGSCRRFMCSLNRPTSLTIDEIIDRLADELSRPINTHVKQATPTSREWLAEVVSAAVVDGIESRQSSRPTPQADVSDIGTRLHKIIEREAGTIDCGDCQNEIARLNQMTADQVREERDTIADGIVGRAKSKAPKFWQRWGATLAPGIAASSVIGWIDEALGPS